MTDGHHLLPRFFAQAERVEREHRIAQIILEVGSSVGTVSIVARATLAGDERRLRGIPVVGRGIGGVAPNTQPLAELMRKQPRE